MVNPYGGGGDTSTVHVVIKFVSNFCDPVSPSLHCPHTLGVRIVVAGGGDTSLNVKSQMTTSGMIDTIYIFPGCEPCALLHPHTLGQGIVVAGGGNTSLMVKSQRTTSGLINTI